VYPSLDLWGFTLETYPFMMGVAWAVGYIVISELLQINKWKFKNFTLIYIAIFVFAWLGSKLAFAMTHPRMTLDLFTTMHFWFGGGLVFYGGFLLGLTYIFWLIFFKKYEHYLFTSFIPAVSLGHGIGRVGCFLAGCCYGQTCDLPWSIHLHGAFRHPVQLYEAVFLVIFGIWSMKKVAKGKIENITITYLAYYSLLRFILEFFRDDQIRGIYLGLSTSQWVSGVILLAISLYISFLAPKRSRRAA
jgi:phosphatidylglycerol:prolipoprotein diacylglycerol transferase